MDPPSSLRRSVPVEGAPLYPLLSLRLNLGVLSSVLVEQEFGGRGGYFSHLGDDGALASVVVDPLLVELGLGLGEPPVDRLPVDLCGPLPRRSAPAPWPVLAVDRKGQREAGQPATHPSRGRALPGVDRQRPTPTRHHRQDARSSRHGHRTPAPRERSTRPLEG